MAIVKSKMGRMLGPCGEPAMRVDGEEVGIRAGVIAAAAGSETSGRMGHGRESRSGSDGRIVGLIGAIGAAEILAHLLKSEPALGDVGRAEPASSIALDKTLGEEKVCDAFSPDLDVLLGSKPLWTAVDKAEAMDAKSVARVASAVVVVDFITFLAADSACDAALFGTLALLLGLCGGYVGGSERTSRLGCSLRWRDGRVWLAMRLGDHGGGQAGGGGVRFVKTVIGDATSTGRRRRRPGRRRRAVEESGGQLPLS
jgi:hypothetical protein